jgi:hypothetical protein
MAKIVLEGPQPIAIIAKNHPTSIALNGRVSMTLPVYDPHFPDIVVQIQILMTPDDAEYAKNQLGPAVTSARSQIRYQQK